ncbi:MULTISPECIES: hypothetical protein [unclassified Rathayibacter]|uniref:hypothetical protein n=1 Tax=unclassified Rathayibacter TaxID=2609250 RepID=UPI0006FD7C22|nr:MULTISPECIES: hypothetical protein [unclassified Rathayibacter]KQQ00090.1 hypothetical protein ASF42_17080 [Rathayibacter sp. Leaf294]KQS09544.1 hypothetical protein ASG06_17080 [Rathayibacter sp. Leaf185]
MSMPSDRDGSDPNRTEQLPDGIGSTSTRPATGATPAHPATGSAPEHRAPVDQDSAEAKQARAAARKDIHQRERDRFGGLKIGCAFFGWLAATGLAVILTALVTAIGAAVVGTQDVTADLAADPAAFGWVGAIALLVILLVAYYSGGYVAGRMARFNGAKQGVAVWAWAVIVAILVGIASAITGGSQVLSAVSGFPTIPLDAGDATVAAIVTALAALVVSLVGAVLGGLAGMRFHRRVDREGLAGLAV